MGSFTLAGNLLITLLTNIVDTYFGLNLRSNTPVLRGTGRSNTDRLFTLGPIVLLIAVKNFVAGTSCYLFRGMEGGAKGSCFSMSNNALLGGILFYTLTNIL